MHLEITGRSQTSEKMIYFLYLAAWIYSYLFAMSSHKYEELACYNQALHIKAQFQVSKVWSMGLILCSLVAFLNSNHSRKSLKSL